MSKLPPVPPDNRTDKGPGGAPPVDPDTVPDKDKKPNLEQQGRYGDIHQNTHNVGYQQDR